MFLSVVNRLYARQLKTKIVRQKHILQRPVYEFLTLPFLYVHAVKSKHLPTASLGLSNIENLKYVSGYFLHDSRWQGQFLGGRSCCNYCCSQFRFTKQAQTTSAFTTILHRHSFLQHSLST